MIRGGCPSQTEPSNRQTHTQPTRGRRKIFGNERKSRLRERLLRLRKGHPLKRKKRPTEGVFCVEKLFFTSVSLSHSWSLRETRENDREAKRKKKGTSWTTKRCVPAHPPAHFYSAGAADWEPVFMAAHSKRFFFLSFPARA